MAAAAGAATGPAALGQHGRRPRLGRFDRRRAAARCRWRWRCRDVPGRGARPSPGHRRDSPVAVLFIDIDKFKDINDRHGHAVGDALLVQVGTRLRAVLRTEDSIARLGGDELLVVCEDINSRAEATALADRTRTALAQPYNVGGLRLEQGGPLLGGPGRTGPPLHRRSASRASRCWVTGATGSEERQERPPARAPRAQAGRDRPRSRFLGGALPRVHGALERPSQPATNGCPTARAWASTARPSTSAGPATTPCAGWAWTTSISATSTASTSGCRSRTPAGDAVCGPAPSPTRRSSRPGTLAAPGTSPGSGRRRCRPTCGSSSVRYLEQNVGALDVRLDGHNLAALEAAVPRDAVVGARYGDMSHIDA